MLLRFLIAGFLFVQLIASANAAIVKGVLTGQVTSFYGTNLAGDDDTAAFASILPFSVGSTVQTEFAYDTVTYQEQFTHNVTGSIRLTIDGTTFFEQATTLNVTPADSATEFRNRFIMSPGLASFLELESLFPAGWEIDSVATEEGNAYALRAVGLFGTTDLPAQGFGLPIGPWDVADFASTDFWIMTRVFEGGSSTWTVPGGGTHTGLQQAIFGTYSSLTISVVPEPASGLVTMIGIGIAALCYRQGKRAH